jgi:hypothetical protein
MSLMNSTTKVVCLGIAQGGGYNFYHCPKEVIGFDLVLIQWKCFALETTMFKSGRALKKLTLVYKSTTINEFIDYMKPKL